MNNSRLAIVCGPRTGSTLACELLSIYSSRKHQFFPLPDPEFFSDRFLHLDNQCTVVNNRIVTHSNPIGGTRLEMYDRLLQNGITPPVKLILSSTPKSAMEYFIENNFKIILVTRDAFDAFISYCVAAHTKTFIHTRNTVDSRPVMYDHSIEVNDQFVTDWVVRYKQYTEITSKINPYATIDYSDFADDYFKFYEMSGIFDYKDYVPNTHLVSCRRRIVHSRSNCFADINELRHRFKSALKQVNIQ